MKPKVRPIQVQPIGEGFLIQDPLDLSEGLILSYPALFLLSLMDGSRDIGDIKAEFFKATGNLLSDDELMDFIQVLDDALILEGEPFKKALKRKKEELLQGGIRPMSHAGDVYPRDPEECKNFLSLEQKEEKMEFFGLMVPHMDIRVAKSTYWEGYGRLKGERKLVILLGVSHYWHEMPFSVLPLDMETPFGILKTRKDLIEKLQSLYSFDITHDLLSYRMEHSIEFASLYAKMLFPEAQALAIIVSYGDKHFLKDFAEKLIRIVDKELSHTLIVSSVDLSHVGKKFGDIQSYDTSQRDKAYLSLLESLQVDESFDLLSYDNNSTRIDGQYTNLVFTHMLRLAGVQRGQLLDYSRYYEKPTDSIVSYAALGF